MAGLLGPPRWAEDLPWWAEGPPSVLGRDVLGTSGCCRCKFPIFIWFQVSSAHRQRARTLRWGGIPLSTLLPLPVGPLQMGLPQWGGQGGRRAGESRSSHKQQGGFRGPALLSPSPARGRQLPLHPRPPALWCSVHDQSKCFLNCCVRQAVAVFKVSHAGGWGARKSQVSHVP